jgi:AraC family transcriptional regulator
MRPSPPPAAAATAPSRRLYESALLRAGRFEIAADAPGFADAGQMRRAEFVFPRSAVWIEHQGTPPFAADPTIVTLYNGGEPYRRRALAADGDRCDWYAVAPEALLDVVASVDPAIRERPERPFRFSHAPVDASSLVVERRVARALSDGDFDPVAVEATMLELLHRIVAAAYARAGAAGRGARRESRRRVAEEVKAFVLPRAGERLTLDRIARAVDVSPFHLCRRFKAETGETLHGWLLSLRLRLALERVAEPGGDLAAVALDAGFASHSHFTHSFRRAFGLTPSDYRRRLATGTARASHPVG